MTDFTTISSELSQRDVQPSTLLICMVWARWCLSDTFSPPSFGRNPPLLSSARWATHRPKRPASRGRPHLLAWVPNRLHLVLPAQEPSEARNRPLLTGHPCDHIPRADVKQVVQISHSLESAVVMSETSQTWRCEGRPNRRGRCVNWRRRGH